MKKPVESILGIVTIPKYYEAGPLAIRSLGSEGRWMVYEHGKLTKSSSSVLDRMKVAFDRDLPSDPLLSQWYAVVHAENLVIEGFLVDNETMNNPLWGAAFPCPPGSDVLIRCMVLTGGRILHQPGPAVEDVGSTKFGKWLPSIAEVVQKEFARVLGSFTENVGLRLEVLACESGFSNGWKLSTPPEIFTMAEEERPDEQHVVAIPKHYRRGLLAIRCLDGSERGRWWCCSHRGDLLFDEQRVLASVRSHFDTVIPPLVPSDPHLSRWYVVVDTSIMEIVGFLTDVMTMNHPYWGAAFNRPPSGDVLARCILVGDQVLYQPGPAIEDVHNMRFGEWLPAIDRHVRETLMNRSGSLDASSSLAMEVIGTAWREDGIPTTVSDSGEYCYFDWMLSKPTVFMKPNASPPPGRSPPADEAWVVRESNGTFTTTVGESFRIPDAMDRWLKEWAKTDSPGAILTKAGPVALPKRTFIPNDFALAKDTVAVYRRVGNQLVVYADVLHPRFVPGLGDLLQDRNRSLVVVTKTRDGGLIAAPENQRNLFRFINHGTPPPQPLQPCKPGHGFWLKPGVRAAYVRPWPDSAAWTVVKRDSEELPEPVPIELEMLLASDSTCVGWFDGDGCFAACNLGDLVVPITAIKPTAKVTTHLDEVAKMLRERAVALFLNRDHATAVELLNLMDRIANHDWERDDGK